MDKKICALLSLLFVFTFVFSSTGVLAQEVYVGDSFELPSISVQGNYEKDDAHQTYFACLSNLDGVADVVPMSETDTCELSRTFDAIEGDVGDHVYSTAIRYVSREWTPIGGWTTVGEGVDNSQIYEFEVKYVVPDDEEIDSIISNWISGILADLQNFFCDNFNLFCSEETFYRFEDNSCSEVSIYLKDKTDNDYLTLAECEGNIVVPEAGTYWRIVIGPALHPMCEAIDLGYGEATAGDYTTLEECQAVINSHY